MALEIFCPTPACRRRFLYPDSSAGKSVRCQSCGQTFIAGASATVAGAAPPRPAKASTAATGTSIGRFIVREKLGAGAFGTVYRAFDPILDRDVAVKVPNAAVMDDEKRIERFLREAKSAAGLRHPHIVAVFDAGKDGDRYFIASAFIDGKPLSEVIPTGGAEFVRCARFVRELAEALAYAHQQGVVHRDVKPANVMVDALNQVHLMDFGLAARQDDEARLTIDGTVMGTPSYMAPEHAAGLKGEAKAASDQYSAGVVLYELLTGHRPFEGPIPVVLHNVVHTTPDSPLKYRPDVPKDLETICLKAMAKRPEDRYADCQALADDLRRWLEGEPILARRLSHRERLTRWVRKEPYLAGAGAVIAVLLVLGMGLVFGAGAKARENARVQEGLREKAEADSDRARTAETKAEDAFTKLKDALRAAGLAGDDLRTMQGKIEEMREKADDAEKRVVAARKDADDSQKRVEDALKQAVEAQKRADVAEQAAATAKLDPNQRELALAAYPNQIRRVQQAIEARAFADAEKVLGYCGEQARGAEWKYLKLVCDRSAGAFNPTSQYNFLYDLGRATFSSDGMRVLIRYSQGVELYDMNFSQPTGRAFLGRATFNEFEKLRHLSLPCGTRPLSETYLALNSKLLKGTGKGDIQEVGGVLLDANLHVTSAGRVLTHTPDSGPLFLYHTGRLTGASSSIGGACTLISISADGRFLATSEGESYDLDWEKIATTKPKANDDNFLTLLRKLLSPPKPLRIDAIQVATKEARVAIHEKTSSGFYVHTVDEKPPLKEVAGSWPNVSLIRWNQDDSRIAVLETAHGRIHIIDTRTASVLISFPPPGGAVLDLAFHSASGSLMAITDKGKLHVWHAEIPKPLPEKK